MISTEFRERIISTFGSKGERWLVNLPTLIAYCEEVWEITECSPIEKLSYHYVTTARRLDGTNIILKCGVPTPELDNEIAALTHFNGDGAVRLLGSDRSKGIILLELLEPGELLKSIRKDEQATEIAALVMKKLWKPILKPASFPTIEQWFKGLSRLYKHFNNSTGPFPSALVDKANKLSQELMASQGERVLLHGDLHHENILSATREPWLVIDPKGVIGEREYEVGALLRNPFPEITNSFELDKILAHRASQLSEILTFDKQRILAWSFAQAVLAAWWCFEDTGINWDKMLICASALDKMT